MGSSSSKKTLIKVKQLPVDEFYEKVEKSSKSEILEKPLPTQYLVKSKPCRSSPFLIDHSSGIPVLLDLRTSSSTAVNIPVSADSRVYQNTNSSILVISSKSCTQVAFPSLKKIHFRPMNSPRKNFSVTSFEGKILVTGGEINGNEVNNSEMFDGESWIPISSLNISRSFHSSIEHQDCVYVFGGFKTDTIEKLQGRWIILSFRLPNFINRIGLSPLEGRILVVGGEVIGSGYNLAAWEFDISTEQFLQIRSTNFHSFFYNSGSFFQENTYLMGSGLILEYDPHYKQISLYT
jgi:hypothetical protein